MKTLKELTQNDVRELINYDPETGKCYWRTRDVKWFKDGKFTAPHSANMWNAQWAGTEITRKTNKGHYNCSLFYQRIMVHHLIWMYMIGEWPKEQIDHINGIPNDNRWCNLREVTSAENQKNMKRPVNNTSGSIGVVRNKAANKWQANIGVNGKSVYLGLFEKFEDAVAARKAAEIKYGFHENHGRG